MQVNGELGEPYMTVARKIAAYALGAGLAVVPARTDAQLLAPSRFAAAPQLSTAPGAWQGSPVHSPASSFCRIPLPVKLVGGAIAGAGISALFLSVLEGMWTTNPTAEARRERTRLTWGGAAAGTIAAGVWHASLCTSWSPNAAW